MGESRIVAVGMTICHGRAIENRLADRSAEGRRDADDLRLNGAAADILEECAQQPFEGRVAAGREPKFLAPDAFPKILRVVDEYKSPKELRERALIQIAHRIDLGMEI